MPDLIEAFQDIEEAQVRVVATIDSRKYEIEFIRDDLIEAYSREDFEDAYKDLIANQISADDFRQTVGFSDLNCQLFLFDETAAFLFPSSRYDSIFISFDYEYPFPLRTIVNTASTIPHLSDEDSA
ncbi:hypothetical protein [Natrinema sp. 1APR25-10V2]|uniref:hypothetical protein n=1 Tax=Natrinema sp. 1APR25-10V2 TaxID=2951081 RepID=UPI002874CEDD|nr:hypothetical protein [Natrinema sp. 1APR25-10V2]MDS0474058.1 hypothetical protein [Natrinema sp. 1APR25-10V2]